MGPPLNRRALCAALVTIGLGLAAGCARHPTTPLDLTEATTRAVYDGDLERTRSHFDDRLRGEVTAQSVAALSGVMHRYGDYRGVTQIAQIEQGRYDYEAQFSNGTMLVQVKFDPGGREISAYRVVPNEPQHR